MNALIITSAAGALLAAAGVIIWREIRAGQARWNAIHQSAPASGEGARR